MIDRESSVYCVPGGDGYTVAEVIGVMVMDGENVPSWFTPDHAATVFTMAATYPPVTIKDN